MYAQRQTEIILAKLKRLSDMLHKRIFAPVDTVEMAVYTTKERLHRIPERNLFVPCTTGDCWNGEGLYCWFAGTYQVPGRLKGIPLYIFPKVKGYEGFLWVNGHPYGNFTSQIIVDSHGNHYCDLLTKKAEEGERIEIALEYYAHHFVMGTQPFEKEQESFDICYDRVDICTKDEETAAFYYDLLIVLQMAQNLQEGSFRKADLIRSLIKVNELVEYDLDNGLRWKEKIRQADRLLQEVLKDKNAAHAGYAGLIGHSHMDTAWLWPVEETVKKCARTYANQLALMDQYAAYTFIQSSALHTAMMEKYYPDIFEGMKKRIAEGRYEPNGGVWVECDCNIPGGEYMIRQFLWGQRYTKEKFGYEADCFWLPDTFGYSASLPQIMKGCKIDYFLTTKIAWNDTNSFPYDTFYWEGIDRSRVFVHMNRTHICPDPRTLLRCVSGCTKEGIKEKTVTDQRLISYGFGDGGGGPEFEMIELAERLKDVEGLPRTEHVTVSRFMNRLEKESFRPSVYSGELYLELHRGTLTNQHQIKRNNRKAETGIRNLEFFLVADAVEKGYRLRGDETRSLVGQLLLNQFHDILPGTCIPAVHDKSLAQTGDVIRQAAQLQQKLLETAEEGECLTVYNTLSFDREDVWYLPLEKGKRIAGNVLCQETEDLSGQKCLAVGGVKIPAFGSRSFAIAKKAEPMETEEMPFCLQDNVLITPYYRAEFDERGFLASLYDRQARRELRGEGYPLNTFLLAEDVPNAWDNWDIDADIADKWQDCAHLLERRVVSAGSVEFRIRSSYQLTEKIFLKQDMIFYSTQREICFDTEMDWQEEHRFLKTAFDTSIQCNFARHEIQFGYIERPTHQNTDLEKAKFEVCNHKYTDLSEPGFGAALLNDCKYGISTEGGKMRLSLHKGGCRPDYRGDKGKHSCTYAFLPHPAGFSAKTVVQPAYAFNIRPVAARGNRERKPLFEVDAPNVLAEAVKPMENGGGYAIRLYEAEGTAVEARISLGHPAAEIVQTNMLEEKEMTFRQRDRITLQFKPFEIKTICVILQEETGKREKGMGEDGSAKEV